MVVLKKDRLCPVSFCHEEHVLIEVIRGEMDRDKGRGEAGFGVPQKKKLFCLSVGQAELGSNHILHAKVPCEMSQKHVRLLIIAETDVSCLSTEGGEGCVSGMGLICPLRQVLRGAGADTINLMLRAVPRNSTGHWEHS